MNWYAPTPPDGANGSRGAGNWLRSGRGGRLSSRLPLHLAEAFIVGGGAGGPAGGVVRFRMSDGDGTGRSRRPAWRRTELGRQLGGSGGELRLVRPRDDAGIRRALIAMLTLNGVTDVAALVRLDVVGTPAPGAGQAPAGRSATVGVDVRFWAGLWNLAVPESTRCQVYLEGRVRVLPGWPMPL
ncbi:hypothetical protein ABZ461_29240 [Actinacidiphila glaucinigra]|uniref:hypothetical protein n=1 Tax=Actinacidiphila glaucinigra TaxID=235986 RepID=UPI0033DD9F0E